jgi:hypothetical protein
MVMFMPKRKPDKQERALIGLMRRHIYFIRGHRVLLSTHLAGLYEIEARVLVQAVRRNWDRFSDCAAFQLTTDEFSILKSPAVISEYRKIRRSPPYAFNEQGLLILATSGILGRRSHIAAANAAIIRTLIRPYPLRLRANPPRSLW